MKTQILAVLFASLSLAPPLRAQEAQGAAAQPRHRLVGVILSTSQALLWDDESAEYQLRRVGDEMLGGQIVAMEEDVVILERGDSREEIGISAPPQRRISERRSRRLPAMIIQVAPSSAGAMALAPMPPRPAMAPPSPAPTPAAAPPAPPPALPAAPQAPPAPPLGAEGAAAPLSRVQLDRELGTLGAAEPPLMLSANPQGGFRITALRAGSLAESMGLRPGDVVLRIDGRPINSISDAASAYAWLKLTDRFTMDVVRDGRLLALRYSFSS